MRNEISIQAISHISNTGEPAVELRDAPSSAPSAAASSSATTAPIYANPAMRLDPSLGLVVIEFRDSSGSVTKSFPTQREIRAYKQHAMEPQEPDNGFDKQPRRSASGARSGSGPPATEPVGDPHPAPHVKPQATTAEPLAHVSHSKDTA